MCLSLYMLFSYVLWEKLCCVVAVIIKPIWTEIKVCDRAIESIVSSTTKMDVAIWNRTSFKIISIQYHIKADKKLGIFMTTDFICQQY